MNDLPVTAALAARIETAEVHAWLDMIDAAPAAWARAQGLERIVLDGVVAVRCRAIPFVHFNNVLNLGIPGPADERLLDELIALYAGLPSFAFYDHPFVAPAELGGWLAARGLRPRGGWDRIHRLGEPAAGPPAAGVELVDSASAGEWAAFIDRVYGLKNTPWLLGLVGRPDWHHAVVREGGAIAAARSMYVDAAGDAWLGIDAPVPGLMTRDFGRDLAIVDALVRLGLAAGARSFTCDIEAPSPARDTPAYPGFAALGFGRAYLRKLYGP